MDALNSIIIAKALDGLSARGQAIASNIANANSSGYRPLRVDFEQSLKVAALAGQDAVAQVMPVTSRTVPSAMATEMRLDLELATASQTAMRYTALLDMLGREMAISRAAIAGGR